MNTFQEGHRQVRETCPQHDERANFIKEAPTDSDVQSVGHSAPATITNVSLKTSSSRLPFFGDKTLYNGTILSNLLERDRVRELMHIIVPAGPRYTKSSEKTFYDVLAAEENYTITVIPVTSSTVKEGTVETMRSWWVSQYTLKEVQDISHWLLALLSRYGSLLIPP
jgi:hypothetical protein